MTLQETIIAQLGVKPSIDPKEEIRKSVDFLKAYMLKHPSLKHMFWESQEVKILHWLVVWHNLRLKSSVQRQEKTISYRHSFTIWSSSR